MEFKAKGFLKSNPHFNVKAHLDPLNCKGTFTASGKAEIDVSAISFDVGQIPLKLTIPFMKCRKPVTIAALGGFRSRINPFSLNVKKATFEVSGICETDKVDAQIKGEIHCCSEVEANGKLKGKITAKPSMEINMGEGCEEKLCD